MSSNLPISGSGINDWIDKHELMRLCNLSARTVDAYIEKGIRHYTPLNKRKRFCKPHLLHYLEPRYR